MLILLIISFFGALHSDASQTIASTRPYRLVNPQQRIAALERAQHRWCSGGSQPRRCKPGSVPARNPDARQG